MVINKIQDNLFESKILENVYLLFCLHVDPFSEVLD